jgi:hypothetical protein
LRLIEVRHYSRQIVDYGLNPYETYELCINSKLYLQVLAGPDQFGDESCEARKLLFKPLVRGTRFTLWVSHARRSGQAANYQAGPELPQLREIEL